MAALDLETETVAAIRRAYADAHDEHERTYLGCSVIGDECERRLWYGFRWAVPPERLDGRKLRLFATGHREEARMVDDLRRSGVTVLDTYPGTDEQISVSAAGGHFRGHLDGEAMGVKEAPKTVHLLECKTHAAKSFRALLKEGVRTSKPAHYDQMQVYMHLRSLTRALYLAHNKDDDDLYSERVERDPLRGAQLVAKAERIVTESSPPPKLHEDPSSRLAWMCPFCPALGVCHEGRWARRNCRTCLHATPEMDGDGHWSCARHRRDLSPADQRAGCAHHAFIPALVPGEQIDADEEAGTVTYTLSTGAPFVDGPALAQEERQ